RDGFLRNLRRDEKVSHEANESVHLLAARDCASRAAIPIIGLPLSGGLHLPSEPEVANRIAHTGIKVSHARLPAWSELTRDKGHRHALQASFDPVRGSHDPLRYPCCCAPSAHKLVWSFRSPISGLAPCC